MLYRRSTASSATGGPDRLRTGVQFVFTGDYIDRGRHALRIIDRLQRLALQNPGQIITLLGNHELMALEAYDEAAELLRGSATGSKRGVVAAYGRLSDHGRNGGTEFIREFGDASLPAVRELRGPHGADGRYRAMDALAAACLQGRGSRGTACSSCTPTCRRSTASRKCSRSTCGGLTNT